MSKLSIHDKINLRGLVQEMPKIGREQFIRRFRSLKIGVTGQLERDFAIKGELRGMNVIMTIIYDYYGDFTHHGVGRSVGKTDKSIARLVGSRRRPKPWKKGVAHMKYRLGELYQELMAEDLTKSVGNQIERGFINNPLMLFDRMGK